MNDTTKLTLRLNRNLINFAKQYSKEHGISVSQLVHDYFTILVENTQNSSAVDTPITSSLTGILRQSKISEKDYRKYLKDKY